MSYSQARNDRERILRGTEDAFQARLDKHKRGISREVSAYLTGVLKVDDEGRVVFTLQNNRAVRRGIPTVFARFFNTDGIPLLRWLYKKLRNIFFAGARAFRTMKQVQQTTEQRALRVLMDQIGFSATRDTLIRGGYLERVFRMEDVAEQVARDIIQLLPTKPTLKKLRDTLEKRFMSGTGSGYLQRHFDRFTRDLLFQFDAATQQVMARDLGLTYFEYSGTLIRTSRCFCERRVNRVYTTAHAEKWNDKQWRGKIEGGDFFVNRGGYNCRHAISYITEAQARRILQGRGIKINTYNNAGCNERRE